MKDMLLNNGMWWKRCQFRRSFHIRKQAARLPSQRLCLQDYENYWGDIYAVGLGEQISLQHSLDHFYHTEIENAMDRGNDFYPTLEAETLKGIAKRMGNTSGGNDGIPTVVLKHLPDHLWHDLAQQFSGHILTSVFPATWQTVSATLVPKLAYASSPQDFRPIAVTDAFERLFDTYLLCELRKLELEWHTHQCAARRGPRGKQPQEVMAMVRNLLHHCFSMGLPLVMVKLDIKKAFDHVSHEALLRMLRERSVPPWLTRTVMALVSGRRLCFKTPAGRTRPLAMGRGIIQGKPTSALLFCLLLDWALKDVIPGWRSRGPATIGTFCSHAIFMDDLLIFGKTVKDVEHMISDIVTALANIGLALSVDKTVWAATPAIELQHLTLGQHAIPRSGTVPFLGCMYCPGNPGHEDLLPRLSKAWGVFHYWKPLLLNRRFSIDLRIRLLCTTAFGCLQWGFSSWSLSLDSLQKMRGFINTCTARVLRPPFTRDADGVVTETWLEHHTRSLRHAKNYLATTRGHPLQHWLHKHATLQGHLLRHNAAFLELTSYGSPAEMSLRRLTVCPLYPRRGRPRRWNNFYLTTSEAYGIYNYWRIAADRDAWREYATFFTKTALAKLRIFFHDSHDRQPVHT
eukprot:4157818-Amphidinium_carterae.2